MDSKEVIKTALSTANMITTMYLGDLTDEELMHRPATGCNHIKWQLGHLITSEHKILSSIYPGSMPELPAGFAERYVNEQASVDDPAAFDSKAELMQQYEAQRAGTLALLDKISVSDLSKESPEAMKAYAPTYAAAFLLQDGHWLMHAGQWAVIRRQLGRPPLF